MRLKNLIILASISVLFTMCAPSRPAVVSQPEPPPMWGPVGYDDVRYYYFPDMMVYYDVYSSMYIYPRGNRWVSAYYLPNHYGHYDLYNTYKVGLMDYYGPSPYHNFNMHRQQYAVGNQWPTQATIGVRGQNGNHYAPTRPRTSSASAQPTRGSSTQQSNVRGNSTQTNTRGNDAGTRSTTAPAVRNPSDTRVPATTPRATPTTPRANPSTPRVAPAETRSSTRLPQPDARAVRERTQQIRQQNRSTAPAQRSTGTTTPTTTRGGGGRGN